MEEAMSYEELVELTQRSLFHAKYRRWEVVLYTPKGGEVFILWAHDRREIGGWVRRMGYTEAESIRELSNFTFGESDRILIGG